MLWVSHRCRAERPAQKPPADADATSGGDDAARKASASRVALARAQRAHRMRGQALVAEVASLKDTLEKKQAEIDASKDLKAKAAYGSPTRIRRAQLSTRRAQGANQGASAADRHHASR
jgi:hypothetical protein